jgi:hypothetical protein
MATWREPEENKSLRDLVRDVLVLLKEEEPYDFTTSIRGDKMYAEIYANKKLVIREEEDVPDGDFDDDAMEARLIIRLLKTALTFTVNSLLEYEDD